MKTLFPPVPTAHGILGVQKEKQTDYKLTRYCLRAPCAEGELLYNTLTGEMLLLPADETMEQNRAELIARHFLVPVTKDEYTEAKQLRTILRLMQPKSDAVNHFLVFTTSDCNARCFYCYELGRERVPMSDRTADDTADYMLRASGGKELSLIWFGGEPLYNRAAIDRITARLREADVPFRSKMVSNGYLFDEALVQTAVQDWKLRSVQIPLDGTEEIYNRSKAFIYREGSAYSRVMRNIGLLLDAGVHVAIRLNLDVRNYDDLIALIHELAERFPGPQRPHVYVALLHDFGTAPQTAVDDEERLARWRALNDILLDTGLAHRDGLSGKLRLNYCMADRDECLTVAPDGSVGKCEHECEHEALGHVRGESLDQDLRAAWKEQVKTDHCAACELFPVCFRLEKCAWTEGSCLPIDRAVMRDKYVRQMLCTYENKGDGSADAPDSFGDAC